MTFRNLTTEQQELISAALDSAQEAFATSYAQCPLLIVAQAGAQAEVINLSGADKQSVGAVIAMAKQVASVLFVSEAWTTRISTAQGSAIAEAVRTDPASAVIPEPRTSPDRREAVMVQFFHKKRHILCVALINRPPGGTPTLEPWTFTDNAADGEIYKTNFSPPGARLASGIV